MHSPIGHDAILSLFDRLISRGMLGHAYLFAGPPGVGKTVVAQWVAQRLLCRGGNPPSPVQRPLPCGTCPACAQVERGVHPDVLRISGEGSIGIDAVRAWVEAIHRSALLGGWKAGILEDVDRCTEEAANAMLKALEEPPPRTVLLLTATRCHAVLPTIVSRTVPLRFRRVPAPVIAERLRTRGMPPVEADATAAASDGRPGRALGWMADPEARAAAATVDANARAVLSGSAMERLRRVEAIIAALPEDRADARAAVAPLLDACVAIGRQELAHAVGFTPRTSLRPTLGDPNAVSAQFVAWLRTIGRARHAFEGNASPRLVLEAIALAFP